MDGDRDVIYEVMEEYKRSIGIPPKKRMRFLDHEQDDEPLPLRSGHTDEFKRFLSATVWCDESNKKRASTFTCEKKPVCTVEQQSSNLYCEQDEPLPLRSGHTDEFKRVLSATAWCDKSKKKTASAFTCENKPVCTVDQQSSNMFFEKDNRGRVALMTGEGTEYFDVVCTNDACIMYCKYDKSCIISIGSCARGRSAFQCTVCGFKWHQWRKMKDEYGNLRSNPDIKPSNKRGRHEKIPGEEKKRMPPCVVKKEGNKTTDFYAEALLSLYARTSAVEVVPSVARSTVPSTAPSTAPSPAPSTAPSPVPSAVPSPTSTIIDSIDMNSSITPIPEFVSSVPPMTPMQTSFCMVKSVEFKKLAM